LENDDVTTAAVLGASERWVVETIDGEAYPIDSPVLANAPLRLFSEQTGRRLAVNDSGDVRLTSATGSSHLRINGPFHEL
jgi:hypothetical protein